MRFRNPLCVFKEPLCRKKDSNFPHLGNVACCIRKRKSGTASCKQTATGPLLRKIPHSHRFLHAV